MPVNLKVTLGTINYTDWLHVTASKVSAPSLIVWEDWIDVPVSNYNFVIPNLDPENYYVRYYDSPTNSALGTLQIELLVNALTGETISERRFYTVGGPRDIDPADGTTHVIDPYLINKNVTGCFKENFRYFELDTEYTFDDTAGDVEVINGTYFTTNEKFIIEITYNVSSNGGPIPGGLYTGTLSVTEPTKTLLASDIDKRIRCFGLAATQVITLCSLSSIAIERGFYFDNSCGGTAIQVKILVPGTGRIRYNGFMVASDLFPEFWISKGEHLLIRKFDDNLWEIITDYKGIAVGSRMASGLKTQACYRPEDGSLTDGDEYGRVWWWLNNVLPVSHVITDATVTDLGYVHPPEKVGLFVMHPTLKKFRWPNTQGISEKGLLDFNTYEGDGSRTYDYPGGFQEQALLRHNHAIKTTNSAASSDELISDPVRGSLAGTISTKGSEGAGKSIAEHGGDFNIVNNTGVIYMRHI